MKQVSKTIGNQGIFTRKGRERPLVDTKSSKQKIKEPSKTIQNLTKSTGPRSQIASREQKPSIVPSPFGKVSYSKLATASSNFFHKSSQLNNSSSGEYIKSKRRSIDIRNNSISPRKLLNRSPMKMPPVHASESVSIREASRIKEWASKAKPEIERIWRKLINNSNGIEPYNVVFAKYSVFIGKGNNANLIRKLFTARPWWQIVETKDSANFVWTQWKDSQFLNGLATSTSTPQFKEESESFPCVSSYKAQIATRVYKSVEIEHLGLQLIRNSDVYTCLRTEKIYPEQQRVHNKLEFNECLSNKTELLCTMKRYYRSIGKKVFKKLPITFSVNGETDAEYKDFLKIFQKFEAKIKDNKGGLQNIWIIKPGEFTNRGQGITVCKTLPEINAIIKPAEGKTYILQKYIEKPLLIHKRKFDIRCYALVTSVNGVLQGYFYLDGYLRTTSSEFSIRDIKNPLIHLTNDAIQKNSSEYGKFESGNKLSYRDFQRFLDQQHTERNINFIGNILPKMKEIVKETVCAAYLAIDPKKRMHCMEIFGYDFMIDRKFRPWLIEINTNPCLELASPYLSSLIPAMVENALKICIDSIFPAPLGQYLENCPVNRFELIFHQETDGKKIQESLASKSAQ